MFMLNRRTLLGSVPLLALAGCDALTPSGTSAAASAVLAIVTDIKQMVTSGSYTPDQVAQVTAQLTILQGVAASLAPGSTSTAVATALATVNAALQAIGPIIPAVLALLGVAGAAKATPSPELDSLRAHYAALKTLAGR